MIRRARRRSRLAATYFGLIALLAATGCRIDVIRMRSESPIDKKAYDELAVDEATLGETLDALGAPTRLEWTGDEDRLFYSYRDELDVGLRFRIPTPLFGYQHTFLRVGEGSEDTNELQFVFDDSGVLREKSIRIDPGHDDGERDAGWRFRLLPHFGYALGTFGDGGERSYRGLFRDGIRAGVDLGLQPVPVLTVLVGGAFESHAGRTRTIDGSRVSFGDLDSTSVHAGVRLSAPFALLGSFGDFDELKRILFDEDIHSTGFRFFLQGTTGALFYDDTEVSIDGVRSGDFYESSVVTTGSVDLGLEYLWSWGSVFTSVSYRTSDAPDGGDSPLDDDAGSHQSFFVSGGLGVRF